MPAKEISSTKKLRAERRKLAAKVRSDLLQPSNELRGELLKLSEAVKLYGVLVVPPDERVQVHLQKAERYSMQVRSAVKRLRVASASSTWIDPDDAPEWTKEDFERADLYHGDKLIRRGRPPSDNPKQALKLRIDPDVVDHFPATRPGCHTPINEALRRAAKLPRRNAG